MSSDYYGFIAGELADMGYTEVVTWPCCEHCDHDPGYIHHEGCEICHV